jgi:hypothetical protein
MNVELLFHAFKLKKHEKISFIIMSRLYILIFYLEVYIFTMRVVLLCQS